MIELLGTIATILAVIGVIMNNRKMIGCFYIWLLSNTITLFIHSQAGIWSLAARDLIFLVLAVEGLIKWRIK